MDANAPANVKLGWLWFDNDPKTSLEEKMDQAAARYRQRFGHADVEAPIEIATPRSVASRAAGSARRTCHAPARSASSRSA